MAGVVGVAVAREAIDIGRGIGFDLGCCATRCCARRCGAAGIGTVDFATACGGYPLGAIWRWAICARLGMLARFDWLAATRGFCDAVRAVGRPAMGGRDATGAFAGVLLRVNGSFKLNPWSPNSDSRFGNGTLAPPLTFGDLAVGYPLGMVRTFPF
jgi:hypothetical protein